MTRLVRLTRPLAGPLALARPTRSAVLIPAARAYSLSHTTLPKMPPNMPREDYASPTMYTFNLLGRTVKFIVLGGIGLGLLSFAAWEGSHLYIESKMPDAHSAPGSLGWEDENVSWTGPHGGTSPKLGWKARTALRAAWLCWEKGAGTPGAIATRQSIHPHLGDGLIGGLNKIDRGYELAEQYLDVAINDAKKRGLVFPPFDDADQVAIDLMKLKASILERMGTTDTLEEAREMYEDLARCSKTDSELDKAKSVRLAHKLSDLATRAGDAKDASKWRQWGLDIAGVQQPEPPKKEKKRSWWSRGKSSVPQEVAFEIPTPTGGLLRATVSLLMSDSATAAQAGDLPRAKSEHDLLVRLIPVPERLVTPSSSTAGETLHVAWLAQRRALLDLYRGSVAHALDRDSATPLPTLEAAAAESDAVISALDPLPSVYKGSLLAPAERLRREALETGAEAHYTEAVLLERQGTEPSLLKAQDGYERAMSLRAKEDGTTDIRGEKEDDGVGRSPEWARYARGYDRVKAKLTDQNKQS